jgi:hypothetical protein
MRTLLLALLCTGCSMGFGSAYVGQWRAREEVVFKACLEDAAGRCIEEKESVRHAPARSFSGVIVPYAAMGASFVTHEGKTTPRYRIEPSLEYVRGRGAWAWGLRVGAIFDIRAASSVPAMLVGHYSLSERVSLYAAGGVIPYARRANETGLFGARGLFGFQWALGRVHGENYWVLSFEGDTSFIKFAEPYRATGVTGHLGFFF